MLCGWFLYLSYIAASPWTSIFTLILSGWYFQLLFSIYSSKETFLRCTYAPIYLIPAILGANNLLHIFKNILKQKGKNK